MNFFKFKKRGDGPDYLLIAAIVGLVVFGLIALSTASSDRGKIYFNDTYYYLKHQAFYGLTLGIAGFFLAYNIYYKYYKKIALPLLLLGIAALVFVLFSPFGVTSGGSTRWLSIGPVTIQPSEILKVFFLIYLAAWLSSPGVNRKENFTRGFLPFLFLSGLIGFLLIIQPATSTVFILLLTALIVYFMSGARISYIALFIIIGVTSLSMLIYITPYRLERFTAFLRPEADLQGSGFQLNQALITIGSGGLTGVGYGHSTNKYKYLPESIGDSIFAIIAEELGFIGAAGLIFTFFVLVLRGLLIARNVRDEFGKLLMVGLACLIGIQVFVNIAAISGLMPLTGVTLPFISYGGTSLAVFMTIGGIMANISKYA